MKLVRRRRRLRSAMAAAFVVIAVLIPSAARADGPRVLFVAAEPTPFSARVRAEIEAMGFEIEPGSDVTATGTTAIAAARVIERPARRIELWIVDGARGRLTQRATVMPSPDDDEASQTVRASEQLRAFFQPLRPHEALVVAPLPVATAPIVNAPVAAVPIVNAPVLVAPLVNEPAPALRPRFVVGAEVAVPFQPGGPAVHLGLKTRWMALEHLGVGGFLSVPLIGSTVKAAEGSASLTAPLVGLDLTVVASPTPRARLTASAGLALAWVRTSGFAEAPYRGTTSGVVAALPIFGAGFAPRLTERTSLYLDGRLGFALSRVDISFAGRPVAAWGRPLGMLALGVSVDL